MVALTDTLRDDFDVADVLYTLTTACVELLDVDAATHDGSEHLERLQVVVREGPCLDAVEG